VVDFQQIDKTAVASKFGHTTYANIYMGERSVQTKALWCPSLGRGPLGVGFVSGPRASRPLLLPYGIIVLLVRGLGPVPFVHDGSGSFSRRGARFAFRPEGIWWIDGLWPAICLMIWESVSDVGLRLHPIQFSW